MVRNRYFIFGFLSLIIFISLMFSACLLGDDIETIRKRAGRDNNNDLNLPSTPGLYFELINNGTAYSVSRGTATDEHIVIPVVYNELPVTEIGSAYYTPDRYVGGFAGFSKMISIFIPNSVTFIGYSAFVGCTSLVEINFSADASIGDGAFSGCTSLIEVNFPAATSIGHGVFVGCTSLVEVNFPAVTSIGHGAFAGSTSLTEVNFPTVTSIGAEAFGDCTSLVEANFPAATSIDSWAFARCTNLSEINFPVATSIGYGAFVGSISLTEVYFPAVTSIGDFAFSNCFRLASVTIGTITLENFSTLTPFPGNLRDVYFEPGNGAGTYTTTNPGNNAIWVKQQ